MREARIPSQNALAKASGVPQATISRILKGNGKKGPETETVRKLAAAVNVSFEWLNEGSGPKQRNAHKTADVHPLPAVSAAANEPKSNLVDPGAPLNADALVELLALYQLSTERGRNFILESARVADKRDRSARWVLTTENQS
jgi:transcriptional regulator with XRE-family HTH domain